MAVSCQPPISLSCKMEKKIQWNLLTVITVNVISHFLQSNLEGPIQEHY
jgi:hypothetical protein